MWDWWAKARKLPGVVRKGELRKLAVEEQETSVQPCPRISVPGS